MKILDILDKYRLKENEVIAFWNIHKDKLPQNIKIITEGYYNEIEKIITPTCSYKLIIIAAELNKEGSDSLNNYEGLLLIRRMRLANIKIPILLCSPQPKEEIIDKYGLLKTKGCYFLRLEQNSDYPSIDFEPLSQMYLEDIKYSFLDLKGALRSIKHDITTDLTNNVSIEKAISFAKKKIAKLFDNVSDIQSNLWSNLSNDLKELKDLGNSAGLLDKYFENILRYLRLDEDNSNNETKTIKTDKTPWTVLYVEDSEGDRVRVTSLFEKMSIRCIAVSNSEDCFNKLDKPKKLADEIEILKKEKAELEEKKGDFVTKINDISDKIIDKQKELELEKKYPITLIITDWRLKHNDDWQELQGYEILSRIAKGDYNIPTFVMITNKRDAIIRSAKSIMPYKVRWYYKTSIFYNEYERQLFAEDILDMGNEAWEIVNGLKCKMFDNKKDNEYSFKEMYMHFLRQPDFEIVNKKINDLAFQYYCFGLLLSSGRAGYNEILNHIKPDVNIGGYKGEFPRHPLGKSVRLPNLYAKLLIRLQYLAMIETLNDPEIKHIVFDGVSKTDYITQVQNESILTNKLDSDIIETDKSTWANYLNAKLRLSVDEKRKPIIQKSDLLLNEKNFISTLEKKDIDERIDDLCDLADQLLDSNIEFEEFIENAKQLLLKK